MKKLTSIVAGLVLTGALGASAVGSALANPTDVAQAHKYKTKISFRPFDHTRGYGSSTIIKGQVVVPALKGAAPGVRVELYRKFHGSSDWTDLGHDETSHTGKPVFKFTETSLANARYRVVYRGSDRLDPSRNATVVQVFRLFNGHLADKSGKFHGKMSPLYANQIIYLDKRPCASCGWRRVKHRMTSPKGRWHFRVTAPGSGRDWWRVETPASTAFIKSYSAVFSTALS